MTEIRSYRRVFDLERRVYSIDRLRLNPGGVPVRGLVYLMAILALMLLVGELPLLGDVSRLLPWYLRDLALPGLSATLLSVIRIEGRTFHLAAAALLRFSIEPRRLIGVDRRAPSPRPWRPEDILQLPDGSDSRLRRLRYTGPGAVLVACQHERRGRAVEHGAVALVRGLPLSRRPALILSERAGGGALERAQVIALNTRTTLLVRRDRGERR